jgi:hypothetical protein
VSDYRAYVLDDNDHIIKRYEFVAENDSAALEIASKYVDGHDVELWQRQSFVRRLKHEK